MAGPTYDPSYSSKNQAQLGGQDWVVAGNLAIDEASGGRLYVGGVAQSVGKVTFTPAPGAANVCLVTIQVVDSNNVAVPGARAMEVWLSDAATGVGETATTASGAVGAGASGTDLIVITAKKRIRVLTDSTGKYVLSITDTAKTLFFVAAILNNLLSVSAQLTTPNYG